MPTSIENFAKNFEIVKKHNSKKDRLYDMELNQYADLAQSEMMNLKPELDELAKIITPYMSVMEVQDSWDWSQTNKLSPV